MRLVDDVRVRRFFNWFKDPDQHVMPPTRTEKRTFLVAVVSFLIVTQLLITFAKWSDPVPKLPLPPPPIPAPMDAPATASNPSPSTTGIVRITLTVTNTTDQTHSYDVRADNDKFTAATVIWNVPPGATAFDRAPVLLPGGHNILWEIPSPPMEITHVKQLEF